MGLGVRVYAYKVEQLVVVARIYDDPPVLAEPYEEGVVQLGNGPADRVAEAGLPWYEKTEGRLAGTEQLDVFYIRS